MEKEVEKLKSKLAAMGVKNFHVSWGEEAHLLTAEQRAFEMNRVLDLIESGDCEEIFDVENGLKFESHEQCREFYALYPEPTWSMSMAGSRETYMERVKEYEDALQLNYKNFMVERCKI